jgi:hypothetical protein
MDMQTPQASSVAAKGAFARAGGEEIVVAFGFSLMSGSSLRWTMARFAMAPA